MRWGCHRNAQEDSATAGRCTEEAGRVLLSGLSSAVGDALGALTYFIHYQALSNTIITNSLHYNMYNK
jgi:hypothetical protein